MDTSSMSILFLAKKIRARLVQIAVVCHTVNLSMNDGSDVDS